MPSSHFLRVAELCAAFMDNKFGELASSVVLQAQYSDNPC